MSIVIINSHGNRDLLLKKHIKSIVHRIHYDKTTLIELNTAGKTNESKAQKLFWSLVIIVCFLICVYQIGTRIAFYRSVPINVDVGYDEVSTHKMPKIILCTRDTEEAINYTWDKPHINTECFPNIGDYVKSLDLSVDKVWKLLNTTNIIKEAYLDRRGNRLPQINMSNTNIVAAMCTEIYHEGEQKFGDRLLKMNIMINYPKNFDREKCPKPIIFGTIQPVEQTIFNTAQFVMLPILSKIELAISIRKYNFLNTRKNPCVSLQKSEECDNKCHQKHAYKQFIKDCRFPFMDDSTLPYCISSNISAKLLFKAHRKYESMTTAIDCHCNRICHRTSYVKLLTSDSSSSEHIEMYFSENIIRTMMEKYAYGIISLFCDVGGNLGLYLGLSCLSIVELMVKYIKYWENVKYVKRFGRTMLFVKTQLVLKSAVKNREILYARREKFFRRRQTLFRNILMKNIVTNVVKIVALIVCLYQTYDRIVYFFSYPTITTVHIVEDPNVQLPSIVTCSPSIKMSTAFINYTQSKNSSCQGMDFLDLLDEPSVYANDAQKLWDESATLKEFKEKHSILYVGNLSTFSTVNGNCTRADLHEILYVGLISIIISIKLEATRTCNCQATAFIIPGGQKFNLKNYVQYPCSSKSETKFIRQTLITLNTPRKVCFSAKQAAQCEEDCINTKLTNLKLICRLPFMTFSTAPLCRTSRSAKRAREAYFKAYLSTDVERDCGCHVRCERTIYTPYTIHSESHVQLPLTFAFYSLFDNVREIIEQRLAFPLIKFLCDIGSNLGVMLGISLLTLVDFMQRDVRVVTKFMLYLVKDYWKIFKR